MARPQRRTTKKVKDQSLVESVSMIEESAIEVTKTDANIIDKGFYLDERRTTEILKEEVDSKPITEKKEEAPLLQSDVQAIQLEYEKKIKSLEEEIQTRKNEANANGFLNKPLPMFDLDMNKNERKLVAAIRSEIIKQKKSNPVISRSLLKKEYKINQRYLDDAVKALELKGIIKRESINYSANIKTFSWCILKPV
jgi:hypothetical protein